jgi:hypothetical protein
MGRLFLICLVGLCVAVPTLSAQSTGAEGFVAMRVGANVQAADPDGGTSAAVGGSAALPLSRHWMLEIEGWVPAYIDALVPTYVPERGEFRDVLVAVSAVRHFGTGVRPYLLAGLALSRTQYRTPRESWASTGGYVQAGAGVAFSVSRRIALAPDVRIDIAPLSAILRPSVALMYRFGVRAIENPERPADMFDPTLRGAVVVLTMYQGEFSPGGTCRTRRRQSGSRYAEASSTSNNRL